jgi:GNAT superfamily N-acetyltransferase
VNGTQVGGAPGHTTAAIRRACPADLPALGEFFTGLSVQTRYLRFFAPVQPGHRMLALLCGGADGSDVVVAVQGDAIIGHAMAVDQAGAPGDLAADISVVVADAWQNQGVGSALMRALITGATARGVTAMTMDLLPGNRDALTMIVSHWPQAGIHRRTDCLSLQVELARQPASPAAGPRLADQSRQTRRTRSCQLSAIRSPAHSAASARSGPDR